MRWLPKVLLQSSFLEPWYLFGNWKPDLRKKPNVLGSKRKWIFKNLVSSDPRLSGDGVDQSAWLMRKRRVSLSSRCWLSVKRWPEPCSVNLLTSLTHHAWPPPTFYYKQPTTYLKPGDLLTLQRHCNIFPVFSGEQRPKLSTWRRFCQTWPQLLSCHL